MKCLVVMMLAIASLMTVAVEPEVKAQESLGTNVVKKVKLPRGMRRHGGNLVVPGSQKGKICVFNAQKRVRLEDFRKPMDEFGAEYSYVVSFEDCGNVTLQNAKALMTRGNVQIAVFLIDEPENPCFTLVAPEAHWAFVNVSALSKDVRNEVYLAARVRKALMRAFLTAAGGTDSQYPFSLMSAVKEAKDFDKLTEDPPVDTITRAAATMKAAGVTPRELITYRHACEEGWAPAPTNEYQQAVWDQVHAAPSQPMKIKFDPAKGK